MNQNLYNYKTPKHLQEEVHFFLTKGRITLKAFLLRCLLAFGLILIYILYKTQISDNRTFGVKDFFILLLPITFLVIQAVKRVHDTNASGWNIWNPILLFSAGTQGNNDYGIDPKPQPKVTYFDELNQNKTVEIPKENKSIAFLFIGLIGILLTIVIVPFLKSDNQITTENNQKEEYYYCIGNDVRIRSSKDAYSDYNIIDKLKIGDSVKIIHNEDPIWYEVEYNNQKGFVHHEYLVSKESFIEKTSIVPVSTKNTQSKAEKQKTEKPKKTQVQIAQERREKQERIERERQAKIKRDIQRAEREEKQKKENFRRNWRSYITVERSSYNYSSFGGISNLSITVTNNSDYMIDLCVISHDIIKKNGGIYEVIATPFENIPPHSRKRIRVADTNRGVSISKPQVSAVSVHQVGLIFGID